MKTLDISAVHAFVLIAELHSFTRAADALDSTQSAVSLLLQKLERRLGHKLIERTPRHIRLSAEGAAFLDSARELVSAHETALGAFSREQRRLVIGLSHQMVGAELPALLKRVNEKDPGLVIELRIGASNKLLEAFERGVLGAAIVLHSNEHRRKGERLFAEPLAWIATPQWRLRDARPLRIATQGDTCHLRNLAVRALNHAKIPWTEVFVAQGAATLGAAAAAGLAVAVLSRRAAPSGTVDIGAALSLPALPAPDAVLYSAISDTRSRAALRIVTAALRAGAPR